MSSEKVNIHEKARLFSDTWHPRIVGELNGQHVKLAHFEGEFGWHLHENEDEMFYVIAGEIQIELETQTITLTENEFFIVPRNTRHNPKSDGRSTVMMFEPISTLNTGDQITDKTVENLERI